MRLVDLEAYMDSIDENRVSCPRLETWQSQMLLRKENAHKGSVLKSVGDLQIP